MSAPTDFAPPHLAQVALRTDPRPARPNRPSRPGRPLGRARLIGAFVLAIALTAGLSILGTAAWFTQRAAESDRSPWRQVFREDFDTPAPLGQFPGTVYGSRFTVYPDGWADTSGRGRYSPSTVLSVADGRLTWDMHVVDGVPQGAAVLPTLPTYGQTYGRYSLRFRADPVAGYGLAFLLWPDSEKWPRDGEIDFPEGPLTGPMKAVAHRASATGGFDQFPLTASFDQWHVATIEWSADQVSFLLDGTVVGTSTTQIPTRSMHWVLQTGSDAGSRPAAGSHARIQIDWLEADARR